MRKIGATHSIQECKRRSRSKASKIIEKCLKILLDPRLHQFAESVKKLEIIDRMKIWTLNIQCMNYIFGILKNLETIDIAGDHIIPMEYIFKFLATLNLVKLKKLRLTGPTDQEFMWHSIPEKFLDVKLIHQLIQNCWKLESLTLNLGHFPEEFRHKPGNVEFQENLRELFFFDFSYPEKFRLDSLKRL